MRVLPVLRVLVGLLVPLAAPAQQWNSPATMALVARAVRAHAGDPAGPAFEARARGLVTLHAELGADGDATARLLKVDEIDVLVRRGAAGPSRQVILAWRDSTLFPTATAYHRDHLGIVTDDFGPRIRLGDGDEVAEVPHPLSEDGPSRYDYRVRDTLRLATPAGELIVVTVAVRPRAGDAPAVVGSLDLELGSAALVRSRLTFTGPAYRDPDLEDISIRLERTLIDGRAWLPYRQEIEIRRRSAWLDLPLRGVIRGRWEIADHRLDPSLPLAALAGPPIGGLRRPGGPPVWTTPLARALDSLPAAAGTADLARVREEARTAGNSRILAGLPSFRPGADRVSDVVRVNRVQGLVLGAGARWRPVPDLRLALRAEIGTADGRVTGRAEAGIGGPAGRWTLAASRRVADVSDLPAASGLIGSLAAQEGGRDYGDYVLLERVGFEWQGSLRDGLALVVGVAREWAWSVNAAARPSRGEYRPNPVLGSPPYWISTARLDARATRLGAKRAEASLALELGAGPATYGRFLAHGTAAGRLGPGEATARGVAALGTSSLPARRSLAIGGKGTLPGEPFRAWGGRRVVLAGVEWLAPVPFLRLPLGRYGQTAGGAFLGPFVAGGWAGGDVPDAPWRASGGIRVVGGMALELLDRALRLELGWGLRRGRTTGFTIDLAREWWPIL